MAVMLNSRTTLKFGEFIPLPGAQLRSIPDEPEEALESALQKVWREVGPSCLGCPKADGWRFQIHKLGEEIKLFSRKGNDWSSAFESVVEMIRNQVQDVQAILDTELVGFDKQGQHLEPSKLRDAHYYCCYVLDAIYLGRRNLIPLPAQERDSFIRKHLNNAFCDTFAPAEYTEITSLKHLIHFYQDCRRRRKEGFDGTIIKPLKVPYFFEVLKLKSEDAIDAVVIGAFRDGENVSSLLLAVPTAEQKHWIPIAKVTKANTDWEAIWRAFLPHIVDHRPDNLGETPEIPDIWVDPQVVVEVTMTEIRPVKGYQAFAIFPRKCYLRADKGPEEATPFEQILQRSRTN